MARRFVTPAQRKRRILRDVPLLAAVLVVLALRLDFPILTANQALEAAQVRYFFGPGRVIAALDRRNEHYRYDRYYILQDGDWYAWCEVSRNPGQPFWNPGILLAVENAPELPLVPLVVDGWRDGLILVSPMTRKSPGWRCAFPPAARTVPAFPCFPSARPKRRRTAFWSLTPRPACTPTTRRTSRSWAMIPLVNCSTNPPSRNPGQPAMN